MVRAQAMTAWIGEDFVIVAEAATTGNTCIPHAYGLHHCEPKNNNRNNSIYTNSNNTQKSNNNDNNTNNTPPSAVAPGILV